MVVVEGCGRCGVGLLTETVVGAELFETKPWVVDEAAAAPSLPGVLHAWDKTIIYSVVSIVKAPYLFLSNFSYIGES